MPREVQVCEDFLQWGLPKLRPLLNARDDEVRSGVKGKYRELLSFYMDEYEQQPFAQPDFHQYLQDGKDTLTADVWRKRAKEWFNNHTRQKCLAAVARFESSGGHSELSPFRATSAMELWATTEPERIRMLICDELGVPTSTAPSEMPPTIGARKVVLKREFALLPEGEQEAWRDLSRERKEASDREGMAAISVQERQEAFSGEIGQQLSKSLKGGALGQIFVFSFSGCFVGEANRKLQRFKGHYATTGDRWHETEVYKKQVAPHWTKFVNSIADGMVIWNLEPLNDSDVGAKLLERREELKSFFEDMFKLACDFEHLDVDRFWVYVAENPTDFVSPARLPPGTRFINPLNMYEQEFRDVYKHIYQCHKDEKSVDREARFMYEVDIINLHIAEVRAKELRAQLKKKRKSSAVSGSPSISLASERPKG